MFRNKNIVVSGGLGFIGSNLVRALVDAGARVCVVDNHLPGHGANAFNLDGYLDKVQFYNLDIRSTDFQDLLADADVYFNLAAQTSHMGSLISPFLDIDVNARAQLVMLEYCRQNNPGVHIVFTSTRQVYGRPVSLPVEESHPLKPIDINGVDKLAAENYFRLYHDIYGLKTTSLRLTNTYGPRMGIASSRRGFISTWVKNLIDCKPLEIWSGSLMRDFNYVADVVEALMAVAFDERAMGQVFNLGGERANLQDLSKILIKEWGSGKAIFTPYPVECRKIAIGDIYSSYEKIEHMIGWKPKTSLHGGIMVTLEYYRRHAAKYMVNMMDPQV